MLFTSFLVKYGEIGLKGKNRYYFEDMLVYQIKNALDPVEGTFRVIKESGRIYVHSDGDFDYDDAVSALTKVFGIVGICPMVQIPQEGFEKLSEAVLKYMDDVYPDKNKTFKVNARRPNKRFPLTTPEVNMELGGRLLDAYPELSVDVHNPDILLDIEIRDNVNNIYSEIIPGPGGMPVGTAGKAMLLLSGGIDSPVAGYMIAKRGVTLEATYFHAPPYTSERAKQKVIDLAAIIARYAGPIKLNIVNFTDIQLYIYDACPHDELTIIMRRYMMKIAEHFALQSDCLGLITGESIGQVASQTMQSLITTNEVCTLPVYRPLIAFDKNDIIAISEKIDAYDTSVLPYEDCCTIFVAKHPVTKPNLKSIHKSELNLTEKIDQLFEEAVNTTETIWVKASK